MKNSTTAIVSMLVFILLAIGAFSFAWFAMQSNASETVTLVANDTYFVSLDVPSGASDPDAIVPAVARTDAIVNGVVFSADSVKNAANVSAEGGLVSVATVVTYSRNFIYYGAASSVQIKYRGAIYYDGDEASGTFGQGITVSDDELAISISVTKTSDSSSVTAYSGPTVSGGTGTVVYILDPSVTYTVEVTAWFAKVDDELDWNVLNAGAITVELACALV